MGYTLETLSANATVKIIFVYSNSALTLCVIVDPIIYFSVHHDLRIAALRLFCHKGKFTWENTEELSHVV